MFDFRFFFFFIKIIFQLKKIISYPNEIYFFTKKRLFFTTKYLFFFNKNSHKLIQTYEDYTFEGIDKFSDNIEIEETGYGVDKIVSKNTNVIGIKEIDDILKKCSKRKFRKKTLEIFS